MLKFSSYDEAIDELLENEGLKKKAAKSGISYGTLKKVYNRGMAAWRTGHRPGTTPQQWGMARVNSYIGKGKGTYYGADSDLSGKGKKKKESVGEEVKYPHMMYDPKTGKEVKANTPADHAKFAKMGYTHEKPSMKKEALDQKDKKTLMKVAKKLKGASAKHANQSKAIMKDIEDQKEAISPAEKAAHDRAIAAFKARGGKIKKLPPGKAQGYHGKSDPASGMKGMMDKGDTKDFKKNKFVRSMK